MKKQNKSLGQQIRDEINSSGKSHYQIAKDSAITESTLQGVMKEKWGTQLETARKVLNAIGKDLVII